MTSSERWNQRPYDFSVPVSIDALAEADSLIAETVATQAFQRLKQIRFLGGIDYLIVPVPNGARGNIRYTRYQHSIGVAWLATLYAKKLLLDASTRRLLCIAALVHDIGHAPLSHSLEPIFKEAFGLDHHEATRNILTGQVSLGREIYQLFRQYNLDIDRILSIISGQGDEYHGFFGGPINFDTIEGIFRSQAYAGPRLSIANPEIVLDAAINRKTDGDRGVVDEFWLYKDLVYRQLINSRRGVLADFACQLFMRNNIAALKANDYFNTEVGIFRKLPGLRNLLTSRSFDVDVASFFDRGIAYRLRRFIIDRAGDFFKREDATRYRQSKTDCMLAPPTIAVEPSTEVEQDLFDDDGYRSSESTLGTYA
ncbi:MAG: HD domain-containing protein [Xanthobacteraceae bacterium]